jgi:hypothetical protein
MRMTKISMRTYILLTVVFIASFGCAYFLPINDVLKNIATAPAIAALVVAIYQILKDQAAFERQDYLQRQQQIFNLGATSHMANVAFDKDAEFCEKYMSEVHETVTDLIVYGADAEKSDRHFTSLIDLKKEYAAWVPKDVALQLEPFEESIREMSAHSHLANDLSGQPTEGRRTAITAMNDIRRRLLGPQAAEIAEQNEAVTAEDVKECIRSILGINELTKLRKMLVSGAIKFLEDP